MIPQRDQYTVQSNITGDKIAMGIDQDSISHVLSVLTDLYSNKRRAIVREYSTNAYDAHIEAGVTRPIDVTLPSLLSPFLKVRDYGVGLTVDDVRSIYSQYGASTKRGGNDQNGMLGLGCKSALTYCSQFTVTSVKDGEKIIVNVARDEDGGGSMTVVSQAPSMEDAGTEVVIPVGRNDMDPIAAEARDFFSVWKPGTVHVNGQPPRHFTADAPLKLTDDLYICNRSSVSKVVMGNVAYPAPQLDALAGSAKVIAFVPIGSVSFPPSREALMDTKATRITLAKVADDFQAAIKGAIQREVTAAATPQDAVKIVVKWARIVPGSSVTASAYQYKGDTLPAAFNVPGYDPNKPAYQQNGIGRLLVSSAYGYQRKGYASSAVSIPVGDWPGTVWITDFAPGKYTAQHKNKMVKWCGDNGLSTGRSDADVAQFVMCPGKGPDSKFIDPKRVVSWEVVRKIKLDVATPSWKPMRIPGSYDFYTEAGLHEGTPGDQIDPKAPLFWVNSNKWGGRQYADGLKGIHPKFTLVCLPANRIEKFKRDVPRAIRVSDEFKTAFGKWVKKLTPDQRLAFTIRDAGMTNTYKNIDPSKVNDPRVATAARVSRIDINALCEARKMFARYTGVSGTNVDWEDPLDEYPLFSAYALTSGDKAQHVYDYINLFYAMARKRRP